MANEDKLDIILKKLDDKIIKDDERFTRIDEHLEKIDEHLEKVDEHLEKVDKQLEEVGERLNNVELTIENEIRNGIQLLAEGHSIVFRRLDEISGVKDDHDFTKMRLNVLESRVNRLEEKVS